MPRFTDNYAALISFNPEDYFNYDRLKAMVHILEKNSAPVFNLFGVGGMVHQDLSDYGLLRQLFSDEFNNEVRHCNNFLADRIIQIEMQFEFLCKALNASASGGGLVAAAGSSSSSSSSTEMRVDIEVSAPDSLVLKMRRPIAPNNSPIKASPPAIPKPEPNMADMEVLRLDHKKSKKIREGSLKRAITSCFETLQALENFRLLNYTFCIKILKKFDKVHKPRSGDMPLHLSAMSIVHSLELGQGTDIKNLKDRFERQYAFTFCKGDMAEATCKLRLGKGNESVSTTSMVMFKFGVFCCLILWLIIDLLVRPKYHVDVWASPALPYISFLGNIIVYRWFWGLAVLAWEKHSVNYQVLFGFDDSHLPHYQAIFDDCTNLSIVYLMCFIFYLDALRDPSVCLGGLVPANAFLIVMLIVVITRFGYSYFYSRQFYGIFSPRVLWNLLMPLAQPSTLKDRFAGDMACSLTRELTDMVYATCFIFSGHIGQKGDLLQMSACSAGAMQTASAILTVIPQLIRLCQCLRRQYDTGSPASIIQWPISYNTLKYSGAVLIITLGTFRDSRMYSSSAYYAFIIVVCVIVTIYQAFYDIVVDWGLMQVLIPANMDWWSVLTGDAHLPAKIFLRSHLMYSKHIYYIVMLINPLLRFVWTLSLLPASSRAGQIVKYLSPCLCTIELFRRYLWACLKLEMDHIHNAGVYMQDDGESAVEISTSSKYQPLQRGIMSAARRGSFSMNGMGDTRHRVSATSASRDSVPYHLESHAHNVHLEDGPCLRGPQGMQRLGNVLSLCAMCVAAVSIIWIIAIAISGGVFH